MIQNHLKIFLHIVLLTKAFLGFSQNSKSLKIEMPNGKKGEVIRTLIATVNGEENHEVFIKKYTSLELNKERNSNRFIRSTNRFKNNVGSITFKGIHISDNPIENQVIVAVEDKNYGQWRAIIINFENQKELLVNTVIYGLYNAPFKNITANEAIKTISKITDGLEKKDAFSGTILIAKGKEVLYQKALGEASKRFNVENKLDTKFNLGSMGKMFTAVSILQLKEKNLLNLEDKISKYLDTTWVKKEIADKVTIHHLLSHTSGLGSYFNRDFINSSRENYRDINDYKDLVINEKLRFKPGEAYRYSNTGMLLLGAIIEKITKNDYYTYIEENIYSEARMINSGFFNMDQPTQNLAIGYIKTKRNKYGWENNILKHVIKGGPAGGSYSTIFDLHQFILALKEEKLINNESLKLLWKNHTANYGYGFSVRNIDGKKLIGHSGGFPGISTELIYDINNDYISIILSNYDNGIQLSNRIRGLFTQIINE